MAGEFCLKGAVMSTQVELVERLLELADAEDNIATEDMKVAAVRLLALRKDAVEIWRLLTPTIELFDSSSLQSLESLHNIIRLERLRNAVPGSANGRLSISVTNKSIIQRLMPFAEQVDQQHS